MEPKMVSYSSKSKRKVVRPSPDDESVLSGQALHARFQAHLMGKPRRVPVNGHIPLLPRKDQHCQSNKAHLGTLPIISQSRHKSHH